MTYAPSPISTQSGRFHLYIDDSGSRYSDRPQAQRADGMDYFALGGIIVDEADIPRIVCAHKEFCERWKLEAPLHSTKIRGKRGAFSWLSTDEAKAAVFYSDLNEFILAMPIISISCVIDRHGYVARYAEKHAEPWLLCQTAFAILMERAAKFAYRAGRQLTVYFEEAGKNEDRGLLSYMKSLKATGMPFPGSASAGYASLSAEKFRQVVKGQPNRVTKRVPMVQLADLVLYAMARGGYDEDYPPFRALQATHRIIDMHLDAEEILHMGIKYSCFDTKKARIAPSL